MISAVSVSSSSRIVMESQALKPEGFFASDFLSHVG